MEAIQAATDMGPKFVELNLKSVPWKGVNGQISCWSGEIS
jgi:hypothetical protein